MENRTYHEQKNIEYTKKLRLYLSELPTYVTTFFRGIEPNTQPRTRLAYAIDLKVFFEWLQQANPLFRDKTVRDISLSDLESVETFDLEEYMEYLKLRDTDDGLEITNSDTAIKRKMSALRGLYGYLFKNEMISTNPSVKVNMPKLHEKAIVRLDTDEIVKFLDVVDDGATNMTDRQRKAHEQNRTRDLALMTLLLGTGIRVSECVGLNVNDLDMKNSRIKVTRKGGYEAYVYFGEEVLEGMKPYLEERQQITDIVFGHEDALFLSNQKKRMCVRSVEKMVKKYAQQVTSTKKITPHKLRSTYGTALYKETGDIYLVADVLGHKDVNTTRKHYAALEDERRRMAKDAVKLRKDE